jgi:hypothetical protein
MFFATTSVFGAALPRKVASAVCAHTSLGIPAPVANTTPSAAANKKFLWQFRILMMFPP